MQTLMEKNGEFLLKNFMNESPKFFNDEIQKDFSFSEMKNQEETGNFVK